MFVIFILKSTDFTNTLTQKRLRKSLIPMKYDSSEQHTLNDPTLYKIEHFESSLHVTTPVNVYSKRPQRTPVESPHGPQTLCEIQSSPDIEMPYECSPSTRSLVQSFY